MRLKNKVAVITGSGSGKYNSGDEIKIKNRGTVNVGVKWTTKKELTGKIELVSNGKVMATLDGIAKPGQSVLFKTNKEFTESSWVSARRIDVHVHETHTGSIYIYK